MSVAVLSMTLVACGGSEMTGDIYDDSDIDYSEETLTIWSFTDELENEGDLQYFKDNFTAEGKEYEGMDVEFVIIPTADYLTKILPVLRTGAGAPDVFTGELDMILNYMEGDYLADLEEMMIQDDDLDFEETKDDFVDYIWQSGIDPYDGKLKSLSWQVTPGAIFFKTDMAETVWGSESSFPSEDVDGNYNQAVSDWVSENKFNSLDGLVDASEEVIAHDSNWRLFPNDDSIRWFAQGEDPESWLGEDTLINPERLETEEIYMETLREMYGENIENSLTANVGEWSPQWYQGMGNSFDSAAGDTYQTMAYSLPTWGLFHVLSPNVEMVDADGNTCDSDELSEEEMNACVPKGNWGMASGPNSYFWGGTYLNIYKGSELKEPSYDFVSSMLFDTDRMAERAANADVYARKSIMDTVASEYEGNDVLGGMNHYDYFMDEADKISLDHITTYDRTLEELMGDVANDYKMGEIATIEEAFAEFYSELRGAHPELYKSTGLPYQD